MSITATTTGHSTAPRGDSAGSRRLRPSRPVLLGAGLVVLLAVAALLVPTGSGFRPLDPDSASSSGARALAQVLERRGVQVDVVRSDAQLAAAVVDADTTILVTGGGDVSDAALATLRERGDARRMVLITPSSPALDELGLPATPVSQAGRLEAGCETPFVTPGDTVSSGALLYRPTAPGVTTCFTAEEAEGDGEAPAAYLEFAATADRPETVVFGQNLALANAHITREAHAGIALRLLSIDTSRVVWFVPNPDEDEPATGAAGPSAPAWIPTALAIVALTVLLLCLWRGRRLGPLTVEPLPVIVPAGETTSARARLYRRSADHRAMADILTTAAMNDIRRRLRLPADADPARIADAVQRATGEDPQDVLALLTTPVAEDDLVDHARRLTHLRRKVRTS